MNINALPGMGPNGYATILLYTADDNHQNAKFTPHGLYATGDVALKVARRMIDWLKDIVRVRGVLTDDDIDLVRRRAEKAFLLYGY